MMLLLAVQGLQDLKGQSGHLFAPPCSHPAKSRPWGGANNPQDTPQEEQHLPPTSCRSSSAGRLPGGCIGSTPTGSRQAQGEGRRDRAAPTYPGAWAIPCLQSLHFKPAATEGMGC